MIEQQTEQLKQAIEGIIKNAPSISLMYRLNEGGDTPKICFFFDLTGDRAKQDARLSAVNWWKRINQELPKTFYFEVACTWLDAYEVQFLEVVTSHNFPNKKKAKPRQKTDNTTSNQRL